MNAEMFGENTKHGAWFPETPAKTEILKVQQISVVGQFEISRSYK
jgi:hypothetical protein